VWEIRVAVAVWLAALVQFVERLKTIKLGTISGVMLFT
jgi:hypothetical protein